MTGSAAGINPAMLRWARERAGYASIADVADRLKWPAEDIAAWESGERTPTWAQFQHLARDLYHRPTGLFFFPEPPEEAAPTDLFPNLPKSLLNYLEPDTRLALREAKARQLDIEELVELNGTDSRQIIRDLKDSAKFDIAGELATAVRDYLNITPAKQFSWRSDAEALDAWRDAIQSVGVWVFQRSFRQMEIAGFCLYDDRHPLVYLNDGQPEARQIFTLFLELAYLLFGFSHLRMSAVDYRQERLLEHNQDITVACNRFAGDLLVPDEQFLQSAAETGVAGDIRNNLTALSQKYHVSRAVMRQKYLNHGLTVPHSDHEASGKRLLLEQDSDGGYYADRGRRLGVMYAELALRGYYQGEYDADKLAEYLDISVSDIDGLENWLSRRPSSQ